MSKTNLEILFDNLMSDLKTCVSSIKEIEYIYVHKDANFRTCPSCKGMCPEDFIDAMSWFRPQVGHTATCDINRVLKTYGHVLEEF